MGGVCGPLFVAATPKGICRIALLSRQKGIQSLRSEFPGCRIRPGNRPLQRILRGVVRAFARGNPIPRPVLHIHGTRFQKAVWKALRRIPQGEVRTYGEIARQIGSPRAARAVGAACARNRIALLIPCHRVIAGDETLGGYAWGLALKKRLLNLEQRGLRV